MLPELAVNVVCIRPVEGARHVNEGLETGLSQPDTYVQAHKALDLLVISEKLVGEFGRKAVGAAEFCCSRGRAVEMKFDAVVGLNDWLSWVFQTLLFLRGPFHAGSLIYSERPVRCSCRVRERLSKQLSENYKARQETVESSRRSAARRSSSMLPAHLLRALLGQTQSSQLPRFPDIMLPKFRTDSSRGTQRLGPDEDFAKYAIEQSVRSKVGSSKQSLT